MFGNKEMKKEKRIIHFSFLPFAKIKKIKRRIYVFNFCVNMNVKEMTIMGKNEILGYKKHCFKNRYGERTGKCSNYRFYGRTEVGPMVEPMTS